MSEQAQVEQHRAVAAFYLEWEEGRMCDGRLTPNFQDEHTFECEKCGKFVWSGSHPAAPPDLLSDAGFAALVDGLRVHNYETWISTDVVGVRKRPKFLYETVPITDHNLRLALAQAAYEAIPKGEK